MPQGIERDDELSEETWLRPVHGVEEDARDESEDTSFEEDDAVSLDDSDAASQDNADVEAESTEHLAEGTAEYAAGESAENDPPLSVLTSAIYTLRAARRPGLSDEYLRSVLESSAGTSPLREAALRAAADLERRVAGLPSGSDRAAAQRLLLGDLAEGVLAAAERTFILDARRSTLEVLPLPERDRFLSFSWDPADFPGAPTGPHETRAEQMFAALTRLRAERRANQGETAAVRRGEFDAGMEARLEAALTPVPGERRQRLHRAAAAAFVEMRAAAAADGVTLTIGNSHRPAARAQASAARAGNSRAVASFSSHTLGLAVDLNMSHGTQRFSETSTRPFQNLVDMYKSPVHKWMFLRSERFGWYPYRREPWHWEYNPPGFRDTLRAGQPGAQRTIAEDVEDLPDPVAAPRPPVAITNSVGRSARNLAVDVGAVQSRLVEVGLLDGSAAAEEKPAAGAANESALQRTIDAIERLQRRAGLTVDGRVGVTGRTRTELDRTSPAPTPAEMTAIATARTHIRQATRRGLNLQGAVGRTSSGNAPADVRAVQKRLVDLGKLSASHSEAAAGGVGTRIPEANLRETIAALTAVQSDVRFWLARGTIPGSVAPGVVAPGDATAALLDRVTVYRMSVGAATLSFRDHVASAATQTETGVIFAGTAPPGAVPLATYQSLGLTAAEAAALKAVSTHEGHFDAINTYDRALVSAGFIQFAGERGLPRYLALLKARHPVKFSELLQKFGIDVEFTATGGGIQAARTVVVDPGTAFVLRGPSAEAAIRDDKRLTAALSVSGRDPDAQQVQIEAAVRDYVRPALNSRVSWSGRAAGRLGAVLRSEKGMAALFDRAIQEGVAAARRRFERVIERVAGGSAVIPSLEDLQAREADILAELERDLEAAVLYAERIREARAALLTLIGAAAAPDAPVAALLARAEFGAARAAVAAARALLSTVVNVTSASGVHVETTMRGMETALAAEESRLSLAVAPPSVAALTSVLKLSRQALASAAAPASTAPIFLARIQRIRRSPDGRTPEDTA